MIDNGNGTVTDKSTGLMWQQETPISLCWTDAIRFCSDMKLAGYTGWRLPTIMELKSLVNYNRCNPAIDPVYFPNTFSSFYWTSTIYAYSATHAWCVHFGDGYDYRNFKNFGLYVRAVHDGNSTGDN